MAFNAYVKFNGGLANVPGNIKTGPHFGSIEVDSYSFGATQTGAFQ
ncbi:MAG: hypothetical protein ABI972_00035 [Acidobacteriota bacterium]